MTGLTGGAVIVTEGGQGIGAAIALTLAAHGAKVSVCDLRAPDATVSAIRQTGGEALGHVCDVADRDQVARAVTDTLQAFGTVDGLVNNAALFATLQPRRLEEWSSEEFNEVLRINVGGTFQLIKAVLPVMRRQGYGKIVNVSSGTVFKGTPLMLPYVSSKGAVITLTRSVAREASLDGIRVNCIAPGFTISEGVEANSGTTRSPGSDRWRHGASPTTIAA